MDDIHIGPIEARIEPEAVRAYRVATTLPGEDSDAEVGPLQVPATFPATWFWHPQARGVIADIAASGTAVPVLTAQRFDYRGQLVIGETYRFEIERRRDPQDPAVFRIEAHVNALDGERIADFSATYRLFELAGASA